MNQKKPVWHVFRSRYIPCVLPILTYWSWSLEDVIGVKAGMIVSVWDKGNYQAIWGEQGFRAVAEYSFAYLQKRINELDQIRQEGLAAGQRVVDHTNAFAARAAKAKDEDFMAYLQELDKLYNAFTQKSMLLWLFTGGTIETKLKEKLKQFSEAEQRDIFKTMSLTQTQSYSQIEEEAFEQLVALARKNGLDDATIKKKIKAFSEQYFWFPYEYVGPDVWDENAVRKRVSEAVAHAEPAHPPANIAKLQEACAKKYALPQDVLDLFAILRAITLMQDDRKMLNAQVCYALNGTIMGELAKRLGVTVEQARYLELSLLQDYVHTKDAQRVRKELQAREQFLVITQEGPKNGIYAGQAGRKELAALGVEQPSAAGETSEIKGQPANPGIARGKVRVLRTSSGVKDFKEGTILVTGMTTPDFVPLMKKAAAIVTDEGGITCHAAIVARELKKPCIIGTKIATKVLKDGDMVEVDANKGVVKKI